MLGSEKYIFKKRAKKSLDNKKCAYIPYIYRVGSIIARAYSPLLHLKIAD